MDAKYEAQCAVCKGLIEVGDEMSWLAPSGELPAVSKHVVCPEKVTKLHTPRRDPETRWSLRDCPVCGYQWAVEKGQAFKPTRCHEGKEAA